MLEHYLRSEQGLRARRRRARRPVDGEQGLRPAPRRSPRCSACARASPTSRSPRGWWSAPSPTPSCRWSPTSRRRATRWPTTTSSPRSPATPTRCRAVRTAMPAAARRPRARPRAPRPRRRLLPAGRHRGGPRRRQPGHQGPARHRQEPDHRQPHRLAVRRRQAGAVRRREARRHRRRASAGWTGSAWATSCSTPTAAPRNRRRLAQELGAALERASDAADPDTTEVERTLVERRTRLTDHASGAARAPRAVGGQRLRRAGRAHPADPRAATPRPPGCASTARRCGRSSRDRVRELGRELDRGRVPRRVDAPTAPTTPGTPPASPPRTRRRRRWRSPAG